MLLYHGSQHDSESFTVEATGLFDGIFCSSSREVAESFGKHLYAVEIPGEQVARHAFYLDHSDRELKDAIEKAICTQLRDADAEFWLDALLLEEYDQFSKKTHDMLESLWPIEAGYEGWEMQRLRGQVARALGYRAVEMRDETGASYLVLSGNILQRIE